MLHFSSLINDEVDVCVREREIGERGTREERKRGVRGRGGGDEEKVAVAVVAVYPENTVLCHSSIQRHKFEKNYQDTLMSTP